MPDGVVVVEETPPPEQTEAIAEAAVEVAQIEADRDVAVAAIEAETQVAAIEAAEVHEEWRTELDGLRASHAMSEAALSERLAAHETQIAHLTETVAIQAATIEALSNPPQPSEPEEPMTPLESPGEGDRQEAETEAEPAKRRRRWM